MKKSNRKGFTIVELVIVIAVIAILAAVLIPTFSNLIKKANESADQQVIRNMNTILATYIESDKEISDVMAYLRSNGYSYEKMVANTKGYHYCYAKSTNQMYLLNEKNEIVYPKKANVTLADLWAAYEDHATSIIPGINNYFAIKAINSQDEFNTAFAKGTYTLDLNKNVCTVEGNTNVTVLNGFVTKGDTFAAGSAAVSVKASDENNTEVFRNNEEKITKVTYTNVLDPAGVGSEGFSVFASTYADGLTIEYVNCVFTKEPGFYQNGLSINLVFTNCTFVNYGTFAMQLQPGTDTNSKTPATVEIKDCDFVNTTRGIHIGAWENITVNVTNCNFALATGSTANNCLQITNYSEETLKTLKINFTNNTVASANGVVYFHDEMTGPENLETFKGVLTNFSGNTYAKDVDLIADRNEYTEGHFLYNNQAGKDALAALIK